MATEYICTGCGASMARLPFPVTAGAIHEAVLAFEAEHADCQEGAE